MTKAGRPFGLVDSSHALPRRCMAAALERLLGLASLQRQHDALREDLAGDEQPERWLLRVRDWLQLDVDLPAGDVDRIPASGPLIVAAEHPTGAMEGVLLLGLLRARRSDVKVLANRFLRRIPVLEDLVLPIDVHRPGNAGGVRSALRHLEDGGALLVFPAGEVAHRRLGTSRACEAPWQATFAGLQRRTGAAVVPVHVAATNPVWFHLAGTLHRHARTALLARALLAQRGRRVALRIGHPIAAAQLERFGDDDRARTDYLRLRTEILERRTATKVPALAPAVARDPVAERGDVDLIAREIETLPANALMVESNGMQTFCTAADRIPRTLREIGRLRELTFRGVGEGSGNACDLDRFDTSYRHLFVWHPVAREIVGAYRLGPTDELITGSGDCDSYTSTLYHFAPAFWSRVSPALELGRSFVQPRYQKAFAPLLLLWRGIGTFVARNPRYRYLFGTVSISADHHATSVRLMVDHLRAHCLAEALAPHVTPRRPWLHARPEFDRPHWQPHQIAHLHDVSEMVRELETGRAGVPILMEHYLKLGARLLGVNVDPEFHTIDALVIVDLLNAPPHLLQRYFGAGGLAALRAFHGRASKPGSVGS